MSESEKLFERIDRPQRLPDQVALSIMSAIENGLLKPGDKLPTEQALSKRFGVARTVIREAVSLLKYDGVITSKRGVGTFITQSNQRSAFRISPACFEKRKQIVQLLQFRTGVQAGASAIAAQTRTDAQMKEISSLFLQMEEADAQGPETSLERRVDLELLFYHRITEASANDYYVEVTGMIESNIQNNFRSAFLKNAAVSEFGALILAEHRAVLDALLASDAEAARVATRERFEAAADRLSARADFI